MLPHNCWIVFFSIIFYLPSTNKFFFFLHVLKLHLNYHLPPQLYLDISFNIINMITGIDSCQQSCPYHVSIIKPDIRLPSFMLEIIILKMASIRDLDFTLFKKSSTQKHGMYNIHRSQAVRPTEMM